MEINIKPKERGSGYQSLFSLPNLFRSFLSFEIHHLAIFDALI